ncbi:MAG: acylneuraminate cytidylyltransferase [Alphaproteobacteria bacterium]|nr:acylneuraminate cytidylyltransferase [Alphaproteobacteria bacterium]|tara:strand:- start:6311 stop:7051 length:741 start_codon:yes stop_codon:yes gene_type:complete
MNVLPGVCWGLIPARGGSRSVPLKNIADLGGRPLLDYCALAAQQSASVVRIICSTDSQPIEARCRELQVEVSARPAALSGDSVAVADVIVDFLRTSGTDSGGVPECIALLQPTSPFIVPEQIDTCVKELLADPLAGSAQTVIDCPHNHHAYNQRLVSDGYVNWRFAEERLQAYNKQSKPKHHLFGNLVVFRSESILQSGAVFADPSIAVEVPAVYGFDCDGPDDFRLGDLLLQAGFVSLPHIEQSA